MSLPLATTTVTILRPRTADLYAEPYSGTTTAGLDEAGTGIRAVIDVPNTGVERVAGGEQTETRFRLIADPCDLNRLDQVRDDGTGVVYRVLWVGRVNWPDGSVSHVEAALELVEGLV